MFTDVQVCILIDSIPSWMLRFELSNQPVTWQQISAFRHIVKTVKMTR